MRVLGIDPGSRVTGWGLVDSAGGTLRRLDGGCVKLSDDNLPIRLQRILVALGEVLTEWSPDVMAVEKVFVSRNASSALVLGHARGAALCAAVQAGVPVAEYTAAEVKQAVVGRGRADKVQVQHMVRVLLGLAAAPAADEADALACAVCHVNTTTGLALLTGNAGYVAGMRR